MKDVVEIKESFSEKAKSMQIRKSLVERLGQNKSADPINLDL